MFGQCRLYFIMSCISAADISSILSNLDIKSHILGTTDNFNALLNTVVVQTIKYVLVVTYFHQKFSISLYFNNFSNIFDREFIFIFKKS